MGKKASILKKNDGSIIVAAMLVLVLLTIVGLSATSTSNIELNIVGNSQLHKMSFFTAESGWQVLTDWFDEQYPLPTDNLGSINIGLTDGIDNDNDGDWDGADPGQDEIGPNFTAGNFASPGAVPLSQNVPGYTYTVTAQYTGYVSAPGYDLEDFYRYDYTINSSGNVPAARGDAVSQIEVQVGKFRYTGGS